MGVALFELKLDLGDHADITTKDIPNFSDSLLAELPTLREHKCWSGETGGFVQELRIGTDFAHVTEHVILEIQHLADPKRRIYSGWTKVAAQEDPKEDCRVFTIHFQTPSAEIGSLAANESVRIVSGLIEGNRPDTEAALRELRQLAW